MTLPAIRLRFTGGPSLTARVSPRLPISPSNILEQLKTVDGVGSGLDADLLDGVNGADYLARANHTGTQLLSTISDAGNLAALDDLSSFNTGDLTEGANLYFTDERAQDAVGGILVDSSEIDFTYDDATPQITAAIVAGSIDETKLDASVNASLDLADSALQSADIGVSVQAYSANLDEFAAVNPSAYATSTLLTLADETALEALFDTLPSLTSVQGRTVTLADAGADALFGWDDSANAYQNLSAADARTILNVEDGADVTDEANVVAALSGATLSDIGTPASDDQVLVLDTSDGLSLKFASADEFGGGGGVATPPERRVILSNNTTDATNDIDFAAGSVWDSTDTIKIACPALTKRLDAGWAAGTGNGMRNSAAAIADGTYHLYVVAKAAGADPDYYAHTSTNVATVLAALQAETGGASYIYARRVGSIIRASNAIVAFNQKGRYFARSVPHNSINVTNPGTSAVLRTLGVPTGIKVRAKLSIYVEESASPGNNGILITDPDQADTAPTIAAFSIYASIRGNGVASGEVDVFTNTSAQVRVRQERSNANIALLGVTHGWEDTELP